MVNKQALKGVIAERGKTGAEVAREIGITPKTFYERMKKGVFGSDEIETMIDFLDIEDPMQIFFANK